jgi:hypothetical protein
MNASEVVGLLCVGGLCVIVFAFFVSRMVVFRLDATTVGFKSNTTDTFIRANGSGIIPS